MRIGSEIIQEALSLYRSEARFLVRAELDYPFLRGSFNVPETFYTLAT